MELVDKVGGAEGEVPEAQGLLKDSGSGIEYLEAISPCLEWAPVVGLGAIDSDSSGSS